MLQWMTQETVRCDNISVMHAPGPDLVIKVAGAVSWALLLALGRSLAPVHNLIHAACTRPFTYSPTIHTMSPRLSIVWLPADPRGAV